MLRSRIRACIAALAVLASFCLVSSSLPAYAYPEDTNNACLRYIQFHVSPSFQETPGNSWLSGISDGADDWNGIPSNVNTDYHIASSTPPPGSVYSDILIYPTTLGNLLGRGSCKSKTVGGVTYDGYIQLNMQKFNTDGLTANQVKDVTAHEMGHVFGLKHTGENEAASNGYNTTSTTTYTNYRKPSSGRAIMSTCQTVSTIRSINNDDRAALSHRASSGHTMISNGGFEDGAQPLGWMRYRTNTSMPTSNPSPYSGLNSVKLTPSSNGQMSMQQWTNLASTQPLALARPEFRIRRANIANAGRVLTYMMRRDVTYAAAVPGTCEAKPGKYATGKDQNVRTLGTTQNGFVVKKTKTLQWDQIPASSWKSVTGGMNTTIPNANWKSYDFMISFWSDVRANSTYSTIFLDDVRILNGGY